MDREQLVLARTGKNFNLPDLLGLNYFYLILFAFNPFDYAFNY